MKKENSSTGKPPAGKQADNKKKSSNKNSINLGRGKTGATGQIRPPMGGAKTNDGDYTVYKAE